MTSVEYRHPSGQIPAYEWYFNDVNPPVHAWGLPLSPSDGKGGAGAGGGHLEQRTAPPGRGEVTEMES